MQEECPYCSAEIDTQEVSKMRSTKVSIPRIFSYSRATTKTAQSLEMNCTSCDREFTLVKFGDLGWVINSIKYDLNAIHGFVAYGIDPSVLLSNITGVALRNKKCKMDVCFKHQEHRAYVSCIKERDGWHAVSVEVINFD